MLTKRSLCFWLCLSLSATKYSCCHLFHTMFLHRLMCLYFLFPIVFLLLENPPMVLHLSQNHTIWCSLHKKWSFPLRISPVNVTKSAIWSDLLKKLLMENLIFCAVVRIWNCKSSSIKIFIEEFLVQHAECWISAFPIE